jgi:hypothetical protein
MFMYGSILIAVTLKPSVLSSRPVEEAVRGHTSVRSLAVCLTSAPTYDTLSNPADHTSTDADVLHRFR